MTGVTPCAICSAPSDGYLCGSHLGELVDLLRQFAEGPTDQRGLPTAGLVDDLHSAVGHQVRRARGPWVTGTRTPSMPINLRGSDLVAEVDSTLARWHRAVVGPVAVLHDSVAMALALAERPERIAKHPEAARMHAEVTGLHRRVLRALDRHGERIVCGRCDADVAGVPCSGQVTTRQGSDTARCSTCGARFAAQDRRARMNAALADELLTVEQLVRLAPNVTGKPVPRATVDSWIRRQRLRPQVDDDGQPLLADGSKMYRWADFAALLGHSVSRNTKRAG